MPAKNPNRDLIDTLSRSLENPDMKLPEAESARLERLKAVFAHWMEHPMLTDSMIRDWIIARYKVGRAQAYNDIALVKVIFGNAPRADKEFQRYRANALLEMAYAAAAAGNDKKAKALTKIADSIAKINRLDEPEGEDFPFDEIIPKDESFSVDPEVIGIKKVKGIEVISAKLLRKYTLEIDSIDEQ